MLFKTCCRCKVEKPVEAFSRDRRALCGRLSACKDCERAYRQENWTSRKNQKAEYREKNADAIRRQVAAYYQAHKDNARAACARQDQKARLLLTDRYVRRVAARMLGVSRADVTPEQIEIHRASMALKRSARAITTELKKGKP